MVKVNDIKKEKRKLSIPLLFCIITVGITISAILFREKDLITKYINRAYLCNFSVVENSDLIMYNLPTLNINIHGGQTLKIALTLELSDHNDIKTIDTLIPRINDMIIFHITGADSQKLSIYQLKEELLYRINLTTFPAKVLNLDFRKFYLKESAL